MIKCKLINSIATFVVDGQVLQVNKISEEQFDDFVTLANDAMNEDHECTYQDFINAIKPKNQKVEEELLEHYAPVVWTREEREAKSMDLLKVTTRFVLGRDGLPFFDNYPVPVPAAVCDAVLDAHNNSESKYSLNAILNFWQWCMLNPNDISRADLFKWLSTGEFSITDSGMIIAQRCVDIKNQSSEEDRTLEQFIMSECARVQKDTPHSLFDYVVQVNKHTDGSDEYRSLYQKGITVAEDKYWQTVASLGQIYGQFTGPDLANQKKKATVYTDHHTRTMSIRIGHPVYMPRESCDEESNAPCSTGLHVMSKKYNLRYGGVAIYVLVNPMNVVAVPEYDNTKFRCCEYLPFGLVETDENGEIIPFSPGSYAIDYANYSADNLKNLITEYKEKSQGQRIKLHNYELDAQLVREMGEVLGTMRRAIKMRTVVL